MEHIIKELFIITLDHSFKVLISLAKEIDESMLAKDVRIAAPVDDIFNTIEEQADKLGLSDGSMIEPDSLMDWLVTFVKQNYWLGDIQRLQRLFEYVQVNDLGQLGSRITNLNGAVIVAYEEMYKECSLLYRFVTAFLLVMQDVILAMRRFFSILCAWAAKPYKPSKPSTPASPKVVGLWQPAEAMPVVTETPEPPIVSLTPV